MMTQDMIIQPFLSNPTEELLSTIDNKDMALSELRKLPDSTARCYFLWQRDRNSTTRIGMIMMSLKEGSKIFFKLIKTMDYKVMEKITNEAVIYGRLEELKFLLGDKDIANKYGIPSVDETEYDCYEIGGIAACHGQREILTWAIDSGYVKDWNKIAATGAIGGCIDIVENAIANGAKNFDEMAWLAVSNDHKDIVSLIEDRVTNMYVKTEEKSLELMLEEDDWGGIEEDEDTLMAISKKSPEHDDTLIHVAVLKGYSKLFHHIAKRGNRCLELGQFSTTLVEIAAENGHLEFVSYILEKYGFYCEEHVEVAARNGHRDIVEYLLDYSRKEILSYHGLD